MPSGDYLIWIDLEMTGLKPDSDSIIEIATVVTDRELGVLADGPVIAIHQSEEVLARMDDWNQRQHGASGLLARVRTSRVSAAEAEQRTLEFLMPLVTAGSSPMCGNSICQDRRFLARYMPDLERFFHYRNLDVSHAQGAGAPLGACGRRWLREAGRASGQRRHPRVDPRAAALPREAVRAGLPGVGGRLSLVTHRGGCHCGAVAFEVQAPGRLTVSDCNCSICRMSGYQHLIVPRARFTLLQGAESLTEYRFNTGTARHLFCRHCGVKSFYVPRSNPDGYSVNARCLDPATVEHVEVEIFDDNDRGASEARLRNLSR